MRGNKKYPIVQGIPIFFVFFYIIPLACPTRGVSYVFLTDFFENETMCHHANQEKQPRKKVETDDAYEVIQRKKLLL